VADLSIDSHVVVRVVDGMVGWLLGGAVWQLLCVDCYGLVDVLVVRCVASRYVRCGWCWLIRGYVRMDVMLLDEGVGVVADW